MQLSGKVDRVQCFWLSILSWTGLFVCCVDLERAWRVGLSHITPLSPVGFDSFYITDQVLSKADAKNLKRKPHRTLGQVMLTDGEIIKGVTARKQTAVLQGFVPDEACSHHKMAAMTKPESIHNAVNISL